MPVPWTRIPDARSLDPDPSAGCPFLGDGPTGTCWTRTYDRDRLYITYTLTYVRDGLGEKDSL